MQLALGLLSRPALHAATLEFEHPASGQRLKFACELPLDLQLALKALRNMDGSPLQDDGL